MFPSFHCSEELPVDWGIAARLASPALMEHSFSAELDYGALVDSFGCVEGNVVIAKPSKEPVPEKVASGAVYMAQQVKNRPSSFFVVGRGGIVNQHAGNCLVRSTLESHALAYSQTTKALRDAKAKDVYQAEFEGKVAFVIHKAYFLKAYDADKAEDELGKAAKGETPSRHLSRLRTQSILSTHHGINAIRAYGNDVDFLHVGKACIVDLLKKLLCAASKKLKTRTEASWSSRATGSQGAALLHRLGKKRFFCSINQQDSKQPKKRKQSNSDDAIGSMGHATLTELQGVVDHPTFVPLFPAIENDWTMSE